MSGHLADKPEWFKPGEDQISAGALNKIVAAVVRHIGGGRDLSVQYYGDRIVIDNQMAMPYRRDVTDYVVKLVVRQEFDDYLRCMPFVQPPGSASHPGTWSPYIYGHIQGQMPSGWDMYLTNLNQVEVYVAKPYELQRTPWDGPERGAFGFGISSSSLNTGYPPARRLYEYKSMNRRVSRPLNGYNTGNAWQNEIDYQVIEQPYIIDSVIEARAGVTGYHTLDAEGRHIPVTWTDINAAGRSWQSERRQAYATLTPYAFTPELLYEASVPLGGPPSAFSAHLTVVGDDGNFIVNPYNVYDPDTVAGTVGARFVWLVVLPENNAVYPGTPYPCWKGPKFGDYQVYYTLGEATQPTLSYTELVDPPLHNNSAGEIGQFAVTSTHFYICKGPSTWTRFDISAVVTW